MIEAGKLLQNRYRIGKPIGQGGMGAVYVATDERFGSTVAIKETFFSDKNYGKAFEREARLLNNLRHPALPRVSDHFTEENGQFLVMEYIEGDDLSEKMQETKLAFPLKDVLNWADQLLDALDFLHTQEMPVIHRDIKPQNLKLTPRGQIILLDFGLAKGHPTDASHKTASHSVFGYSKNYASLEQMQGTGTDPRSDLYSLGATLYHLMTGSAPIDALTRAMTVLNGDADPLKPANLLHNQVPEGIAAVLKQAMALNANHRPLSATAMRTMLSKSGELVTGELQTNAGKTVIFDSPPQKTELIEDDGELNQTTPVALPTENIPLTNSPESVLGKETVKHLKRQGFAAKSNAPLPANIFGQKKQPKNGLLVGAVIGGLLMAGGAAGLYFVKPNIFRQSVQSESTNAENNNSSTLAETLPQNIENSAASATINVVPEANSVAVAKKENVEKPASKAADQLSVSAKNNVKTTAPAKVAPPPVKEEKEMGENDLKVKGDRLETKEVVADKGRVIYKDPNVRPRIQDGRPPITVDQIKSLPPDQRQKVRRILRKNNERRNSPPDNDN